MDAKKAHDEAERRAHDEVDPLRVQLDEDPGAAPDREARSLINTNVAPPVSAEASEDFRSDGPHEGPSVGHDGEGRSRTDTLP